MDDDCFPYHHIFVDSSPRQFYIHTCSLTGILITQVSRLRKDYDDLDALISDKEEVIEDQLADSLEAARQSKDVENEINTR